MSSQFLTMIRLLFAGLILVTFSFMHGDKIFSILKNRKDALSLLIFLRGGRAHRSANLPAHD
ncbi:Permease of the drug/metabolite transporter (DMT) superfamily [Salmonella enterica subsp. enterica]|nr:Permease of the drug/metabolite transporter (DMT) superfamily [Salmonella enterica subsp. enterica]